MHGKVFLGINNTAGVCTRLKKGFLQNKIGADFYSFSEHIFGYSSDKIITYDGFRPFRMLQKIALFTRLILKYDFFIFDTASTLLPNFKDIKLFRFFGKKTMMIFTGCDIRMPEKVIQYKWNPCRDCNDEYKQFVGCEIETKKEMIVRAEKVFDIIVAPQEASGYLQREFTRAYFPVNLENFPKKEYFGQGLNRKLKILHAPSNPLYKGTKFIVQEIEKLKSKFDFEFKMVSNVSITELYEEIKRSDLIIDQMLTGIYGLFSIESMAMYKPIVCYVREDSWKYIEGDCPIFNTSADGLYNTLHDILLNPNQLIEAGIRSRAFVEKYHDASKIAGQFYKLLGGKNKFA